MTRISQPHISHPHSDRLTARGLHRKITGSLAAIALAGSLTAVGASVAQAQPQVTRTATVVKVVTRAPFGKMLATVHGRSLYYLPVGSCKGACLTAWPPLLMPRGKTIPRGVRCLERVRFGARHQVAYRGKRLYLFSGDSGGSVNGNGLAGFKVAKLRTGPCSS